MRPKGGSLSFLPGSSTLRVLLAAAGHLLPVVFPRRHQKRTLMALPPAYGSFRARRASVLDAESGGRMSDLTTQEQTLVRTALKFLRLRCGTWATAANALKFGEGSLSEIAAGRRTPGPVLAFRVARLAKVPVDDVLAGRFPAPRHVLTAGTACKTSP
jgi:hypothetical protein